ncbi:MAG TPA: DoxX family protein [Terracidiphilus sp.]|nr:DoxX family protein [Terracidiphilus sp.]
MSKLVTKVRSAYEQCASIAGRFTSLLLLLIRLYWGWQFAEDGWGKLHHLARVGDYFAQLNLPAPHATALFVSLLEFAGGVTLAIGLLTRLTALVLFVNMTVAFWAAEKDAFLGVISNPDKFQAADAYNYWFAALLILILGPGLFALDTFFGKASGTSRS